MKQIYFLILSALLSTVALAQNSSTDINVDINKGSSGGGFPWIWVVGALVFIVLLVALLSGGRGGSDRVIEKKTIIKE